MKHTLTLLTLLSALTLKADLDIDVRIFSNQKVQKAVVTTDSGLYYLVALNSEMQTIDTICDIFPADQKRTFYVTAKGDQVSVNRGSTDLGAYSGLFFISRDSEKEFRIDANGRGRAYFGNLQFSSQNGLMKIVNEVNLEKYVAGVVESEAGHVQELEFYKAQAVLARTFAIKNLGKHQSDGYNLKDDVTSQVYYSKAHYKNSALIDSAVEATRDTILVLPDCQPILGVFHANSGGLTLNSEDVWLQPVSYLKSREDTFSIGVGSYQWEKEIAAERFFSYFARMMGVKDDIHLHKAILNFDQQDRHSHFSFQGKKLKLTRLRRDFGLKSTFFTVEQSGDNIVLKGKGFGHGVGLSQDGAIEMSKSGFQYQEILKFYFSGVELESVERINNLDL